MAACDLTGDVLRSLLHFEANTGVFTWLIANTPAVKVGSIAGGRTANGYWSISVNSRRYLAHRLAWLWVHDVWPTDHIDHINGNPLDNRIVNLREASRFVNLQNIRHASSKKRSGAPLGVTFHGLGSKWRARIHSNGKYIHIGLFDTQEEAAEAYLQAKRRIHPGCTI